MPGESTNVPNRNVAVIEDDLRVRESPVNLLVSFDYAADSYESAGQFLKSDRLSRAGCVTTDIEMRQMSGLQLLQHLKSGNCAIDMIIITGKLAERSENFYLENEAVGFFRKPVDGNAVLDLPGSLDRIPSLVRESSRP
jgi:FixJ family two-component response regulator